MSDGGLVAFDSSSVIEEEPARSTVCPPELSNVVLHVDLFSEPPLIGLDVQNPIS